MQLTNYAVIQFKISVWANHLGFSVSRGFYEIYKRFQKFQTRIKKRKYLVKREELNEDALGSVRFGLIPKMKNIYPYQTGLDGVRGSTRMNGMNEEHFADTRP